MELSQPSPHSAVVKINAPTVLEKVKAAVMSNLEESVANTGTSVFRAWAVSQKRGMGSLAEEKTKLGIGFD